MRPHLGYISQQIWSPHSIKLIKRAERVRRRPYKFILNVPFMCEEEYKDRLISANITTISYWHEYLHLTFFYNAFNCQVTITSKVLPQLMVSRKLTRTTSSPRVISLRSNKCKTVTFQCSFFNRFTNIWNSLEEYFGTNP